MSCPPCLSEPSIVSRALALGALMWLAGCEARPNPRVFRDARPGVELRVPSEPGLVYQVAAAPGGARTCSLAAVDEHGEVLARDDGSGPLGLPRLRAPARAHALRLEAAPGAGPVQVYVNDPDADHDGDGLGRQLERALGTCDAPDEPGCKSSLLRDYYRTVRHATRDTDRDGLSDGDELFGVAGKPLLDLPRFGADPRHKDVFVEIDRGRSVEPPGILEADLRAIAALFARGGATTLKNPDGSPGIAVHFDAGFEPSDRKLAGLLGDWGGSETGSGDYKKARKESFARDREHYFRYAVLARSGLGQSSGDALGINRDQNRVALLAHELAHTLGLKHEGHPSWGAYNCKPNHLSIINYAFQNQTDVGFARRRAASMSPMAALERTRIDSGTAARLRAPPFELDASEQGVDWNRDGLLSDRPVRAALTWATYKSCMAATAGQVTLAKAAHGATPALAGIDGQVHAFWIEQDGALAHRSAAISARCRARGCATLSSATVIAGFSELAHIAVTQLGPRALALAYVTRAGDLGVSRLELDGRTWQARASQTLAPLATRDAPAIVTRGPAVIVLYRALDGALAQAVTLDIGSTAQRSSALDQAGHAIFTAHAPSLLVLGTGELCGAFSDLDGHVRFYCHDNQAGFWRDLSARAFYETLGPKTGGPVGLAYHRFRFDDGSFVGSERASVAAGPRGALYLSFTEPAPGTKRPDNPHLHVSRTLDRDAPARYAIDFRWRGSVMNQWTHVAEGTAVALYEDAALPGLVAALALRNDDGSARIELLPAADGVFDAELAAGDDFAVMERGICTGLRGAKVCGGPETAAY